MPFFGVLSQILQATLSSRFSNETAINDQVCANLRAGGCPASREVPYHAKFHSNISYTIDASGIANIRGQGRGGFHQNDSFPAHVDITLAGQELWLIESKLQKYSTKFFNWNFCLSGNKHKNLYSRQIRRRKFLTPIYTSNFYNDQYEGKIWADIFRLTEIKNHMSKTSPPQRLFLLFYLDHSITADYCTNLPIIFNEYYKIPFLATINRKRSLDIWPKINTCTFTCHEYNGSNLTIQYDATNKIVPFIQGSSLKHTPILIEVIPCLKVGDAVAKQS